MMAWSMGFSSAVAAAGKQRRIIWALLMREVSTRYGHSDIGFLWLVAEPLIFVVGVSTVWSQIRPSLEHGMLLIPFLLSGYLPLVMVRQVVNYSTSAIRANQGLLYHRQITPLQLLLVRTFMELIGTTLAAVVVIFFMSLLGLLPPLKDFLDVGLILGGWFLLFWLGLAIALVMGALSAIYEFVERFANIFTYIMIPVSGVFFMAAWMPPLIRDKIMLLPFIHGYELIRRGIYGHGVPTYYNIPLAVAWNTGLTFAGLLLLRWARPRLDIE